MVFKQYELGCLSLGDVTREIRHTPDHTPRRGAGVRVVPVRQGLSMVRPVSSHAS